LQHADGRNRRRGGNDAWDEPPTHGSGRRAGPPLGRDVLGSPKHFTEGGGSGIPIGGRLGERAPNRGVDTHWHRGSEIRDRRRLRHQMLVHDALDRRADEGRPTGQRFVEHTPQAVEIAATVQVVLGRRLLRTHVRRCADRDAGLREVFAAGGADRPGNPEVRHHRVARL
jgi:hypothetical protein